MKVAMDNLHGLSLSEYRLLLNVLRSHASALYSVKLFGSRARGDYKKTSDVDLAVSGQQSVCSQLASAFDESSLPYTVDIVDYDRNSSEALRQNIDRDGKNIFVTRGGIPLITAEQLKEKFIIYRHALGRLQVAVEKDGSLDDMYIDGTVQRFEFCFELAWKLMKSYLEHEGISVSSPRGSIREGFKTELVADGGAWIDMLEKRNLASHTYDEDMAMDLYRQIKEKYYGLLAEFRDEMERRLDAE